MSRFQKKLKDYFYFSKSQRIGLVVLMVLLLSLILLLFFLPQIIQTQPLTMNPAFRADVESFQATREEASSKKALDPFPFDPNTVSHDKMIALGLSDYQTQMILKYRSAGGRFNAREDFSKIYSIDEQDYATLEKYIVISNPVRESQPKIKTKQLKPQLFNPNIADSNLLIQIGLTQKQVAQICNYRNAGGEFTTKNDFRKIYSISEDDFQVLENYILLPSKIELSADTLPKDLEQVKIVLEINGADSIDLIKLRGIGPVFAGRILTYRKKLGGFYDKSQLLEVYGLDTTRYFQFAHQLYTDTSKLHKMDLNNAKFKDILSHPYFEYYLVKSIFNYKDAVGTFASVDELREVNMVYDQLYVKISPYLVVNEP